MPGDGVPAPRLRTTSLRRGIVAAVPAAVVAAVAAPVACAAPAAVAAQAAGGVLFGGVDFSASLGAGVNDWDAMLTARGTIAAACGAAGVPAYDVPFLDTGDTEGLAATTRRAKAMGFAGRACIHPGQVAAVNTAFTPSAAEIAGARAVLAAMEAAGGGVALHDGKMIDRPVVLAAERVLSRVRPD